MARILRGDIRWADLNPVRGSEQGGLRRRDSHGHIPEKYRHREQVIAGPYTIILETGHYRGNPEFRFTCVPQREGFPEREINLDIIAVTAVEDALGRVLGKITQDGSLL